MYSNIITILRSMHRDMKANNDNDAVKEIDSALFIMKEAENRKNRFGVN